jgi:hypothetical protein
VHKNERMLCRAGRQEGYTPRETGDILGVDVRTVQRWDAAWKKHGPDGVKSTYQRARENFSLVAGDQPLLASIGCTRNRSVAHKKIVMQWTGPPEYEMNSRIRLGQKRTDARGNSQE